MAAVKMHEDRPARARFEPVENFSSAALRGWAERTVVPGSRVTSDRLLGFEVLGRLGYQHMVVIPPRGKVGTEIETLRWLNVVLGNLKTALAGTHPAFAYRKYAHRYLAEVGYRFNRRYDLAAMVPRLAAVLMRTTR